MAVYIPFFQPIDYKRSEDLCEVSFKLPGLNPSNFGRNNLPTIKGIMQVITAAEGVTLGGNESQSIFGHNWLAIKSNTTFSLGFDMKMSELMYNKSIYKTEFKCVMSCVYVGRSSLRLLAKFFIEDHPEPVISYYHFIVSVNFYTRKATSFPSWMADIVKGRECSDQEPKRIKQLNRPQDTFVHSVYVTWSNTDVNHHCNFSNYPNFVVDATHAALRIIELHKAGNSLPCHKIDASKVENEFILCRGDPSVALKGLTKEIVGCGVKDVKVHFFKECVEDDLLDIHIWQDGVKNNVLFSSVEKNNEMAVQIIMEYFTSESKL